LINWRLVVNLVFLLLLLLTARSGWLIRATDDQLRHRAKAKRFYGLVSGAAGLRFLWESAHTNDRAYGQYMSVLAALCLIAFLAIDPIGRYPGEMFDRMKRAVEKRRAREQRD
jgi:hypothetical protein